VSAVGSQWVTSKGMTLRRRNRQVAQSFVWDVYKRGERMNWTREHLKETAKMLKELGFSELRVDDDIDVKEKLGIRQFALMDDSTDGPGWTQGFTILWVRGRNKKVFEFSWFGPKEQVL